MSFEKNQKTLVITLVFFLLLRLLFSVWPWFDHSLSGTDLSTFRQWSLLLVQKGLGNFYSEAQFFPYPPVANYFFYVLGWVALNLHQPLNGILMTLLFKLPNILGDLLVAFLLFQIVLKKLTFQKAYLVLLVYLIQPGMFFISTIWGQWDGLMTLFLLLSFFSLIQKRTISGLIFLTLAILTKPQAIPFVLPLLALGISMVGFKKFIIAGCLSFFMLLMLFYPFYPSDPFLGPYSYFSSTLKTFPPRFTSSGFNFWYFLYGGWRDDLPFIFGISVVFWSRMITLIFIMAASLTAYFKKDLQSRVLSVGLAGFAFFMFFTQIHERYFYPVLPFILLGLFLERKIISWVGIAIISLVFAINSIGFYVGWTNYGLWNSTFLSFYQIDKVLSLLYLCAFIYVLVRIKYRL